MERDLREDRPSNASGEREDNEVYSRLMKKKEY
jgi:hypothetical protein